MTVIVGINTSDEDGNIVIASDRASVFGDGDLAMRFLGNREFITFHGLPTMIEYAKKLGMDKVKLKLSRKIDISEDESTIVAHTGTCNETHRKYLDILLRKGEFLQDEEFLKKLLFPLNISGDTSKLLEEYKFEFDLNERMRKGYIPEIRRISDLQVVNSDTVDFSGFNFTFYDRNFNSDLSWYLLATRENVKESPLLAEVSPTGRISSVNCHSLGCGSKYAMEYLKHELGAERYADGVHLVGGISLDKAVKLATEAVQYANQKDRLCHGLDYVVLNKHGLRTFFSDEEREFEVGLVDLIEDRITALDSELSSLRELKSGYSKI